MTGKKGFTGRTMLVTMVAFFGVVVAVNFTMATLAARTFGGTVVDNSYVAGQRFNGWLAQARAQERLGWTTRLGIDERRHVTVALSHRGMPLAGAEIEAVARHPVGRAPDVTLRFQPRGGGAYASLTTLPAGRWLVHVEVRRAGQSARLIEPLS